MWCQPVCQHMDAQPYCQHTNAQPYCQQTDAQPSCQHMDVVAGLEPSNTVCLCAHVQAGACGAWSAVPCSWPCTPWASVTLLTRCMAHQQVRVPSGGGEQCNLRSASVGGKAVHFALSPCRLGSRAWKADPEPLSLRGCQAGDQECLCVEDVYRGCLPMTSAEGVCQEYLSRVFAKGVCRVCLPSNWECRGTE